MLTIYVTSEYDCLMGMTNSEHEPSIRHKHGRELIITRLLNVLSED